MSKYARRMTGLTWNLQQLLAYFWFQSCSKANYYNHNIRYNIINIFYEVSETKLSPFCEYQYCSPAFKSPGGKELS